MPTPDQPPADPGPATRPPLRRAAAFIAIFALGIIAFYGITSTRFFQASLFPAIKSANAHAAGAIISAAGHNVSVHDDTIYAPTCALSIERGCDATEPIALCAAALIAAGWMRWKRLLIALPLAIAALAALNLIRILTLYLARLHLSDSAFTTTHEAWQGGFAIAVIATWIIAAAWTLRARTPNPEPAAPSPA